MEGASDTVMEVDECVMFDREVVAEKEGIAIWWSLPLSYRFIFLTLVMYTSQH